jgi:hypothetical protein
MERQLHGWYSELRPLDLEDIDIEQRSDAVTTELYRIGCLLYVKSVIDPTISSRSSSIQTLVTTFITWLELLPPSYLQIAFFAGH